MLSKISCILLVLCLAASAQPIAQATLGSYMDSSTTSFSLQSPGISFTAPKIIVIGSENLYCAGGGMSGFTSCTRGYQGTTPAAHGIGAAVSVYSVANAGAWGGITGTLSNQTDLASALAGKQPTLSSYLTITGLWASGSCSGYLKSDGTCSTASGGGSVFTGSTATASVGITGTAAAPILSLSDQSVKSPTRFEISLTASTPVTSVTVNNKTAGAHFSVAWTQPSSSTVGVTWGSSVSNSPCPVSLAANSQTEQFFEVASDGATLVEYDCKLLNGTPLTGFAYMNNGAPDTTATTAQLLTLLGVTPVANGGTNNANLTFPSGTATVPQTIASGALALATSSISSAACQTVTPGSVNSAAATGVATTDAIEWTPNGSIKGVTGFVPATTGGLTIAAYPTAGYVNFDVCNWTSGSVTPGAITVNWRVTR